MNFSLQPVLENERALLLPLQPGDFSALFALASNPLVWEQHPNKNRWQEPVFRKFFQGALDSGGAFRIVDKPTGKTAGSTRFYNYNPREASIVIGYTFLGTEFWGTGLNPAVKELMLNYVFQYVEAVDFHIGSRNLRSQIAILRLGAVKHGEFEADDPGEDHRFNFVYRINKNDWPEIQ